MKNQPATLKIIDTASMTDAELWANYPGDTVTEAEYAAQEAAEARFQAEQDAAEHQARVYEAVLRLQMGDAAYNQMVLQDEFDAYLAAGPEY